MIAFLGMYDRAETAAANDRFWTLIRKNLGYGPDHLTRRDDPWEIWQSPDLTFAQTCGYPYRAKLHDKVTLIGTPDYGLPDCPPGYYCSVFVARADEARDALGDFDGARFAYNEPLSQSGWAAPRHHADRAGIGFGSLVRTGGHVLSARAVAEGRADLAALDALTWALICRHDTFASALKPIMRTTPTPGLPYIAARGADQPALFDATARAINALSAGDRITLSLRGLVAIPKSDYLAVPTPPPPGTASN